MHVYMKGIKALSWPRKAELLPISGAVQSPDEGDHRPWTDIDFQRSSTITKQLHENILLTSFKFCIFLNSNLYTHINTT